MGFLSEYILMLCATSVIIAIVLSVLIYVRVIRYRYNFQDSEVVKFPKASVVIYGQGDEDQIINVLGMLSQQDYPDFEVVVVCDASVEYAEMLKERVCRDYKNVYVTFIQPGSHNLSRRKLAYTIGVKASKGEVIVTTGSNVTIPSEKWLSEIMAPFCEKGGEKCDVVLGISRMDFREMKGPWKWYREFDTTLTNVLWVGSALSGNPYRGDGNNLAFRKQVFFDHKGYAATVHLHNGDDDLFVNEISDSRNTKVVITKESLVTTEWGNSADRIWSMLKERYNFTRKWLPKKPFVMQGIWIMLQWIALLSAVAVFLIDWPRFEMGVIAVVLLLAMWGDDIYIYRKIAARFGAVRLWWAVVPFIMWKPIGDMLFDFDHRSSRKKNYTWQR